MSVTCEFGAVPVQLDWFNRTLSPVVYGDITLSMNTQYNVQSVGRLLHIYCLLLHMFDDFDIARNIKQRPFYTIAFKGCVVLFSLCGVRLGGRLGTQVCGQPGGKILSGIDLWYRHW